MRNVRGKRQERLGLVLERGRALMSGAAFVDAALEIEEVPRIRVEDRIPGRHAFHARDCVPMAARAGSAARAGPLSPQALAALDP